eukprot:7465590-Heterocapsa_arctica.AAC.1
MPTAATFQEWKRTLISRGSAASGRGEGCAAWLAEVAVKGSTPEDFEQVPPKWRSFDAKLQSALRDVIKGHLAVRVGAAMDA